MHNLRDNVINNLVHLPLLLILVWALYGKFVSHKPLPSIIALPVPLIRMLLVIITCGLLAGCSNPDPLAVASGPVFALNAGNWQPTPQDLAAPPPVVDR